MKIECPYLSKFPPLKHAFFETKDIHDAKNWTDKVTRMGNQLLPLITLNQIHGHKVIKVSRPTISLQEGDGLVTGEKQLALGIWTADCGPVLFYDPKTEIIGACHAGWKGAKSGILQETLKAMESLGAKRSQIYATLGPTIHQENYEVGPEFPELIGGIYENYFYPSQRKGCHYFNLPLYICSQLVRQGIKHVHDIKQDTYTGNFASRRRFLSQGIENVIFTNLSVIAIF